jgi:hypothetical protein
MELTVFLFDLDGVLVKPGGYRTAVRATVNYFTRQMGLGDLAPADDTIAIFEAQAITCEWDMIPLLLAITLETALERSPSIPRLDDFRSACAWLVEHPLGAFQIDFAPRLRDLGRFMRPGEPPSDSILAACLADAAGEPFPRLAGSGVLADLLRGTRYLSVSRTTSVFETFALGHEVFTRATGMPAEVQSKPLLALHDRALLHPQTINHLRGWSERHHLCMAAYTARPSLPDQADTESLALFTPEAEMALDLIGWSDLPLVGSGQTGEVSRQLGEPEERLIKPSPYHAVAAIAAAWMGSRSAALAWMRQVFCYFERGDARPPLLHVNGAAPEALRLHVFEDSPAGMRGGIAAVDLLEALGLPVKLHLWGVSEHPEKAAALRSVGAIVYDDVNQAVDAALSTF